MNRIGIHIFTFCFVVALFVTVAQGNFAAAFMLTAALAAFRILTIRHTLIYVIIFLEIIGFKVPVSMARNLPVAFFLEALFVGGEILYWIMRPEARLRLKSVDYLLIAFIGLFFLTAQFRGVGLYALGGGTIGGMQYVEKGVRYLFMLVAGLSVRNYPLNAKRCYQMIFYATLALALMRFGSPYLGALGSFFGKFFPVVVSSEASSDGSSIKRIGIFTALGLSMLPFIMNQPKLKYRLLMALGCVGLAAASGFRSGLVNIVFLYFCVELYLYRVTMNKVVTALLCGVCLLGALWGVAPSLDFRMQRTLSVVPGLSPRLDFEAVDSASRSSKWREDLYAECVRQSPKYIFIGRGYGTAIGDVLSYLAASEREFLNPKIHFENHAYHLAAFDLLLDYGGVAFLIFMLMLLLIARGAHKKLTLQGGTMYEKFAVAVLPYSVVSIIFIWSNFHGRVPLISTAYIICSSVAFRTNIIESSADSAETVL